MKPDDRIINGDRTASRSRIDWDLIYWERTGQRYRLRVTRSFWIIFIFAIVFGLVFGSIILYYDGQRSKEWNTPKVKQTTSTQ